MSKDRKNIIKPGYTETGLPTPEEATKLTADVTGQPITANPVIFSPEDLLPKKKVKKGSNEYISNQGRKRINTLMHPELKQILNNIADNNNLTLPDVIEMIICKALGIEEPSKK